MVEKMKYVSLSGHLSDLDRVIDTYLCNYEIHLENTYKELVEDPAKEAEPETQNHSAITTFATPNPYIPTLQKAQLLAKHIRFVLTDDDNISKERAVEILDATYDRFLQKDDSLKKLEDKLTTFKEFMSKIEPFMKIDFRIDNLTEFDLIRYRFGKMPVNNFKQFEAFADDAEIIFLEGKNDGDFVYGLYFVPSSAKQKVDTIMSSLHFERIWLTYEMNGDPLYGTFAQSYELAAENLQTIELAIKEIHQLTLVDLGITPEDFNRAYNKINSLCFAFDARKYAAKIVNDFYFFVGWMPENEATRLNREVDEDAKIIFVIQEELDTNIKKPPIKLNNLPFIKPFEFFVKLYGMPSHDEIDPTIFVAITYTFLFGMMFGDLGQGAVVSALGWFLYKKKGMVLGAIMTIIGFSSMFFGLLYGSVFGLEHTIPTLWMKPHDNLISTLMYAVIAGIILIYVVIILSIYNKARRKEIPELIFNHNGVAGLIFYSGIMYVALTTLLGIPSNTVVTVLLLVCPLLLFLFQEPLVELCHGHKVTFHDGFAQFFLGAFLECFDVVLSFLTNTVSYVRVGAFVLSHAGMMSVVMMFSESANGSINPFVLIFGNIFVMALEGLVVGIQVLRLEFYEMFSRFVTGGGQEFISYKNKK